MLFVAENLKCHCTKAKLLMQQTVIKDTMARVLQPKIIDASKERDYDGRSLLVSNNNPNVTIKSHRQYLFKTNVVGFIRSD